MQTPLVRNWQVAAQTKEKQAFNLNDDNSLLGFSTMVALSRDVHELLGGINASFQMAPDLHNIFRECLQAKHVSTAAANSYLKDLKSLPRYNKAFKLFGPFVRQKMFQPPVQH